MKDVFVWLGAEPACFYLGALGALFVFVTLAVRPGPHPDKLRSEGRFLLVTFLAFLACRWPVLIVPYPLNPDEACFAAQAIKTTADIAPWRAFDPGTSGPLNCYILAVPALLGAPITFQSTHLIGFVLIVLAVLALYYMVKWTYGPEVARLSIVPPVLMLTLTADRNFVHCSSEHLPVCLMTIGLAASAYLAKGGGSKRSRMWAAVIAGLSIGSTPFSKLQALPIALVVFVVASVVVLWTWWSKHDRRVALVFVGMLCVTPAALVGAVWATGEWDYAFTSFVKGAFRYVAGGYIPAGDGTVGTRFFFRSSDMYPAFIWGAIIVTLGGAIAIAWKRCFTAISASASVVGILLVVAAIYAIYKPHRPFEHYLLFLVVPVTCCIANSLGLSRNAGLWGKRGSLIASSYAALFAVPMLSVTRTAPNEYVQKIVHHLSWQNSAPVNAVMRHANRGDTMCVWGWAPEYYVFTGTIMAIRGAETSREIYPHPLLDYHRRHFMDDMRKWNPTVFVDAVVPGAFVLTDRATQGHEVFPDLAAYIGQHYTLREEIDGVRIYVLKVRQSL